MAGGCDAASCFCMRKMREGKTKVENTMENTEYIAVLVLGGNIGNSYFFQTIE